MQPSSYNETAEVLLKRSNGLNKTVLIEDCYSDKEAAERAESMYGMPVLRVIYRGQCAS